MLQLTEKTVLILGAGFTKAFLPNAPLMEDDYSGEYLKEKFFKFKYASQILKNELEREPKGLINLERFLTRIQSQMPYDNYLAKPELKLLLSDIKSIFSEKIKKARSNEPSKEDLEKFAKLCVNNKVDCITFNYDDLFDQYLWEVRKTTVSMQQPYWHPDGGYGFFCRPSSYIVGGSPSFMDATSMLLLKLHGSMNWRIRKGDRSPFTVDSIFHSEDWLKNDDGVEQSNDTIELHLEQEPFIVPPLLTKEELTKQPVLKLVWSLAYKKLETADNVIFIGYSLPKTDIASEFLFSEATGIKTNIFVVNFKKSEEEKKALKELYNKIFRNIPDENFYFDGALNWVKEIVRQNLVQESEPVVIDKNI